MMISFSGDFSSPYLPAFVGIPHVGEVGRVINISGRE
jgi:hypothetical protein